MADAAPAQLQARWERDARTAIATIHDTRTRGRAQARFDDLIVHLPQPAADRVGSVPLRAAAARELGASGRYALEPGHAPQKSWLVQGYDWVRDRLRELLKPLFDRVHVGVGGRTIIGNALILLFVLIVAYAVAMLLRLMGFTRDRGSVRITPLEAQRNAHALMLQATALADDGRHAEAVRTLFRAAVTLLDLRGAITDDVASTVNELRGELALRHSTAAPAFDALAAAFSAAAYAELPVTQDQWQRTRHAYDTLHAAVTTVPA